MAFIKVGNKVLKCGGKVVTNDLVLFVKLVNDGKTLSVVPSKDIASTLTRYMLVLTPDSGSATEVNIGNTGTYNLSSLHGTVQDGKYTLSVYAVLSSGNTAPFGSIEYYVLAPCNAMTLRFKFSKSGYDPVNAGVGSAGTWNHLIDDVWDWTNTNPDWHDAFKGAFTADDNEVEVIGAGDTSGVTNVNKMFAGIFSGTPTSGWSLTSTNNVVECISFDLSNCTNVQSMFCASNLRHANFDLSNISVGLSGFYAATQLTKVSSINLGHATEISNLFARCSALVTVGSLTISANLTNCLAAFAYCSNLEYFDGFIGDLSHVTFYHTTFGLCESLKRIGTPINMIGCKGTTACPQLFANCSELVDVQVINFTSAITAMNSMFGGCWKMPNMPIGLDTSKISNFKSAFASMKEIETIEDINVDSATNVNGMFRNCYNVKYGILEMYNKLVARGAAITDHTNCFLDCGRDTPEGQAALAQIPTDWGGTMST